MIDKIGTTAGSIYQILTEHKTLSMTKLIEMTGVEDRIALMAIGWLARENNITFEVKGKAIYISLS